MDQRRKHASSLRNGSDIKKKTRKRMYAGQARDLHGKRICILGPDEAWGLYHRARARAVQRAEPKVCRAICRRARSFRSVRPSKDRLWGNEQVAGTNVLSLLRPRDPIRSDHSHGRRHGSYRLGIRAGFHRIPLCAIRI